MATAYVNEYAGVGIFPPGAVGQALMEPENTTNNVTFTTSTASAAFGTGTRFIAFTVDAAAHYQIAAAPTATTSTYKIAANVEYVRAVNPGDKIAFVTAA